MTLDTETALPAPGRNGRDGSDVTITRACKTSKSSSSNKGQRRVQGGRTRRGGFQRHVGRFNRPAYISSIRNFKGEMEEFGGVLGTTSEQR